MKLLIINASPNADGQTAKLCKIFKDSAEKIGEVKQLNLHDNPPPFSKGLLPKPEVLSVYQQAVLECDAMFIATPTYWFNVPAILKAFIEDLDPIESDLSHKTRALGVAINAPQGGELGAASSMILSLNHLNFLLVNVGYIFHRGVSEDDWAFEDLELMPGRMKHLLMG
jgi:multimeric flavodoxin WrbA